MESKKRGPKIKLTSARIDKLLNAIRQGKTITDALALSGIPRTTYYDKMKSDSNFSDEVKKAELEYDNWCNSELIVDAKASLKDLIKGYKQITKKTRSYVNKEGKTVIEETTEEKTCPPNATAIIFALCNRDPDNWKNRVAQDVNGKIDVEQKGSGVSLANVPDSLLAQVIDAINGK